MKILFLGTGAADWPNEKTEGMSEFRRLSSALIDGCLLIDPGPQVLDALTEYKTDLSKVKYIINTHRHSDHFCAETLRRLEESGASFIDLKQGDIKHIGEYTVRAYSGNHATCENTVHFIIDNGKNSLFYGLDGAWLLYDEVQAIKKYKPSLAVLDATIGDIEGDYRIFEHNNLAMVLEMKKTLNKYVGSFCISHMAMTLHTAHKALSEKMAEHNVIVAYDGLELEI